MPAHLINKSIPNPLLEDLAGIAESAGKILLDHYHSDKDNKQVKDNGTWVTEADVRSDTFIRKALEKYSIPVISEEGDTDLKNPDAPYWLVDPLDGTLGFIERSSEFAICIARIESRRPTIGVIHAPLLGETYVAQKQQGGFVKKNSQWKPLAKLGTQNHSRTVVCSRHHHNPVTESFIQLNKVESCIGMGSALKFVRVACGDATVYPNFDGSGEWDTAAGQLLVEEVGGEVLDVYTHQPLHYGKPRFRNPFFLAFNPSLPFHVWRLPKL